MSSGSFSSSRRSKRSRTPPHSQSQEPPSDQMSNDWLREAVRMLNTAKRSARAAHLALRSSSALLRPAENLVCASAISLGSAANCLLAASTYLCMLAMWPDSPVPGLFLALRRAAQSVCAEATRLKSQMTPLSRAMHSTAISLALAAASFEEAALEAADRERSRSSSEESSLASVPRVTRSETARAGRSCGGVPREAAARNGIKHPRNVKISHILIKHKGSRRPIDNYYKPVTRTKDQAMDLVIDIHERISRDLITFADAAVSYSECASASRLGDIQKQFKTGRVKKCFEDAAYALQPGQLSHIIESKSGYHILQRRK